jgi:hypothetical protein
MRLAVILLPEVSDLLAMSSQCPRRMIGVVAGQPQPADSRRSVATETQDVDDLREPVRQIDGH